MNHTNRFVSSSSSNRCNTRTNIHTCVWKELKKRHMGIWDGCIIHFVRLHKVFIALMLLMMSIYSKIRVSDVHKHFAIWLADTIQCIRSFCMPFIHSATYVQNILLYLFRENICVDMNSFWRGFNFASMLMKMGESHAQRVHICFTFVVIQVHNGKLFTICDCMTHLKRILYKLKTHRMTRMYERQRGNSFNYKSYAAGCMRKWERVDGRVFFNKRNRIHLKYIWFTSHIVFVWLSMWKLWNTF